MLLGVNYSGMHDAAVALLTEAGELVSARHMPARLAENQESVVVHGDAPLGVVMGDGQFIPGPSTSRNLGLRRGCGLQSTLR